MRRGGGGRALSSASRRWRPFGRDSSRFLLSPVTISTNPDRRRFASAASIQGSAASSAILPSPSRLPCPRQRKLGRLRGESSLDGFDLVRAATGAHLRLALPHRPRRGAFPLTDSRDGSNRPN